MYFLDIIFKFIFLKENVCIWIEIWLESVLKGLINNKSALVRKWICAEQVPCQAIKLLMNKWWPNPPKIYATTGQSDVKQFE